MLGSIPAGIAMETHAVFIYSLIMKTCGKCRKSKSDDDFGWKRRGKLRQSYCKECNRAYNKKHYLDNKQTYRENAKRNGAITIASNQAEVLAYLRNHPCIDCGEKEPIVLEFDHRDRTTKIANICVMIRSYPLRRLAAEIQKCDVRCCNCHRRKTRTQMGWWKR